MAPADLPSVFNEPTWPHAFQGDALAARGVDAGPLAATFGHLSAPDVEVPAFLFIHHLGGAMGTGPDPANVIGNRAAGYLVRMVSSPTPAADPVAMAIEQDHVLRALSVEPTGRVTNFLFGDNLDLAPLADCYDDADLKRLIDLAEGVDPAGILRPARGRLTAE